MKLYVLIKKTVNNVFVIVMDNNNKVLLVKTPGVLGFLGPKRSTPYAAESLGRYISRSLDIYKNFKTEIILVSPFDKLVRSVLKGLRNSNLRIIRVREKVLVAHNGCRLRKMPRD